MTKSNQPISVQPISRRDGFPTDRWRVRQWTEGGEVCHDTTHPTVDAALLMTGVLMRGIDQRRLT